MAPLRKVNIPVFKKCNKKVKAKSEMRECAVLSRTRDIDMAEIIENYELSSVPRSFMDADGNPLHEGENKSMLVHAVIRNIEDVKLINNNYVHMEI